MYIHVGAMNIKLCMSISHKSSLKLQSTKSLLCAVGLRRDKLWCRCSLIPGLPHSGIISKRMRYPDSGL